MPESNSALEMPGLRNKMEFGYMQTIGGDAERFDKNLLLREMIM
jgi:hypothetical protein